MTLANPQAPADRLAQPKSLDDLLLYRIARLLGAAGGLVTRLCEGSFGITRREWTLIAVLARDERLRPSELADRVRLDRARTSRAITSLAAKQLLHRAHAPGDQRQVHVSLSDAGQALYAALFPQLLEIHRALLDATPAAALTLLDETLDALQSRADRMAAQAGWPKAHRGRGGK